MVSYRVTDLEKAKEWYRTLLGQEPSFDSPMAVVFTVGGTSLALVPETKRDETSVVYWGVDDIEVAYGRLLANGGIPRSEIALLMLKSRIARVVDPFGNVVGILSTSDRKKPVEERPSESALTVAFCRALATRDEREELRGPDTLAEIFLNDEGRRPLEDPATRAWMIQRLAGTYEYFIARTAYFDRVVEEALREGVPQLVFLGAGYDTRPYRFRDLVRGTRVFELDIEPTQRRKRESLSRAGVA